MAQKGTASSPALLAAQQLLLSKRRDWRAQFASPGHAPWSKISPPPLPSQLTSLHCAPPTPDHLGWGSDPLSAHLRSTHRASDARKRTDTQDLSWLDTLTPASGQPQIVRLEEQPESAITIHPDIAMAMLRQEQASAGRIWLLLRHIDARGTGWVGVEKARALLTDKRSKLRVCGWRQLRNLLAKGESLFWQRNDNRIWLRSIAKVAAALEVWQIKGSPVAIPVDLLTRGIGAVRAHFYASFHSSRTVKTGTGKQSSMPIARKTIREICHISRRTQRNYESVARVRTQHNYAIGHQIAADGACSDVEKESAWQHGQALFHVTDKKGTRGTPGASYLAWQLPNSYFGPHDRQPRGRQKRINRELADLFTQGMTGNGEYLVTNRDLNDSKRFYGNGRRAAKAYNTPANHDVYWRASQKHQLRQSLRFWHCLPARSRVPR